jgi:carbonic anhydrase
VGKCTTGKKQSPIDIPVEEMAGFSRNLDELIINHELETHIEIGPVLASEIIQTGSGLYYNALRGAGSMAFILS